MTYVVPCDKIIKLTREDFKLRLVSLAERYVDLLGGLKRCFESFVSSRNCLRIIYIASQLVRTNNAAKQFVI